MSDTLNGGVSTLGGLPPEIEWKPPPATMTWTLSDPPRVGTMTYPQITMRAPRVGEVMKATAVPGATNLEVSLRLIETVSAEQIPYAALLEVPAWIVDQIGRYMESFSRAPMPTPPLATPAPPRS
jgi:hypothetical protein